jgi:hypothetical protein
MQPTHVRRHPDNSIDYGFYRRRAARLRTEEVRNVVRRMAAMTRPLIAVALLIAMLVAIPTRGPDTAPRATDIATTTGLDGTPQAN